MFTSRRASRMTFRFAEKGVVPAVPSDVVNVLEKAEGVAISRDHQGLDRLDHLRGCPLLDFEAAHIARYARRPTAGDLGDLFVVQSKLGIFPLRKLDLGTAGDHVGRRRVRRVPRPWPPFSG